MTQDQRQLFSNVYLSHPERFATLFNDPNIDLAQEGGYYSKLGTNSYYDPTSLDSLLGMEKSKIEAMEYGGVYTIGPFKNEYDYMKANNLTVDEILIAVNINGVTKYVPLPILLQTVFLVISP
jgi:hypothetical protein